MHLNLIHYVRRLHVLRSKSDYMPPAAFRKSADRLRKQLRETLELSNAAWLMERLEELGGVRE
ncbi:MAG: hypothetical protein EAZ89_06110 [Bacteroidetes bacterium]|nr:MAG: hypothetical protein EAZ89_06110 [Bacteroidota bacterium]